MLFRLFLITGCSKEYYSEYLHKLLFAVYIFIPRRFINVRGINEVKGMINSKDLRISLIQFSESLGHCASMHFTGSLTTVNG